MPAVTDIKAIRAILEVDRVWSAYALADLEPDAIVHTSWFAAGDGVPALILLYRAFSIPVVMTFGSVQHLRPVFDEVDAALGQSREVYGVVQTDVLPLLAERYHVPAPRLMQRMLLDPKSFKPTSFDDVVSLGPDDLMDLRRLHEDGSAAGEKPEFFTPGMLVQGVYMGVREHGELIAAGGTHIISTAASVAAIGNIYTRRDRRGRGLGAKITSAVANKLVEMQLDTLFLNVRQANLPALRLYEKLGFHRHCEYFEVPAFRSI